MESIEMFPNKSAVALTNVEDELYTIDLIETPRQVFLSAVMTRDELTVLYFQLSSLLYNEEGDFSHVLSENFQLKIALNESVFRGVCLSRDLDKARNRCIELQEEIKRHAK